MEHFSAAFVAASQAAAISLFSFGTALVIAGIRRKQAAELPPVSR